MSSDPEIFQDFAQSLTVRNPKTVRTYLSALRGFVQWLSVQPGGFPFSPEIITETAVSGYLNYLKDKNRTPSTRSQALTALRHFCHWAIGEGYITRNPASQVIRPTVVNTAPRELTNNGTYLRTGLKPNNLHDNRPFSHSVIGPDYASAKWPNFN